MRRRVFVISDLHLGGRSDERDAEGRVTRPGFQICNAIFELVAFIDWIRGLGAPSEEIELVVNGDLVDFLAEDDFDPPLGAQVWNADQQQAVRRLLRIAERSRPDQRRGVFEALRDFLVAGHQLTLLLGNHDVELSLPEVRKELIRLLGGQGHRLTFLHDGEAYSLGGVLIEHGNRYDRWNMVNHSRLRQERSVRSRRLPVRDDERPSRFFVPPAGTYLVVHLMNRIKARYRFIDLLKPEGGAVIPLLLALEPGRRPELEDLCHVLRVAKRFLGAGLTDSVTPRAAGDLRVPEGLPLAVVRGGDLGMYAAAPAPPGVTPVNSGRDPLVLLEDYPDTENVTLEGVLEETLGPDARLFTGPVPPRAGDLGLRDWARNLARWFQDRNDQFAEQAESASRLFRLYQARTQAQRLRQLEAALRHLNRNDCSFRLDEDLSEFGRAAARTADVGGFQVVIYGHTHLPRRVVVGEGPHGPRLHLNTGTWTDIMRLPDALTRGGDGAEAELERFVVALRDNDYGAYIRRYLTFAELELDLDRPRPVLSAELFSYCGPGHERCPPLTNILDVPK